MDREKASNLSSAITTAVGLVTLMSSVPEEVVAFVAALTPAMQRSLETVLTSINPSRMSIREKKRVNSSLARALEVAQGHMDSGESVQMPEFDYEQVEIIIETVLRAAAEDAQEKKDFAFGSLIGHFAYQGVFESGALYTLSKILKDLSYDELLLVAALKDKPSTNYEPIYNKLLNENDVVAGELVNHFLRLKELGLTVRTYPFTTNHTVGSLKLSALGEGLCNLADLDKMDPEESEKLRGFLDTCVRE